MEKYELFYKEILIGLLTVDTISGKHKYEPESRALEDIPSTVPLGNYLLKSTDGFVDPIPFFSNRINNMKRWKLTEINYQTDWFLLKKANK